MSNFSYLLAKNEYSLFANSAIEAEKVFSTSPAMCAVGCRKALELAVKWVYAADKTITMPYKDNLQSLLHEPSFRFAVDRNVWSVLPSIYGALMADKPAEIRAKLEHWLDENNRDAILDLYAGLAEREPLFRWSIQHSNYAYGTSDVYEYLQKARAFTIEPVAERITQDVLLLSAREDLLVDFALYKQEIDLLKNTRSLEFAVPGRALNGQAHCNMGNTRFMLDLILNWIDRTLER